MMSELMIVDLDDDEENCSKLGLISEFSDGDGYTRQFCGHHCLRGETWGAFVRLNVASEPIQDYFFKKYRSWPLDADADDLQFVTSYLARHDLDKYIKLGSGRDVCDGWTSVTIIARHANWPEKIKLGSGILTWESWD
jgi:hypothetical protein